MTHTLTDNGTDSIVWAPTPARGFHAHLFFPHAGALDVAGYSANIVMIKVVEEPSGFEHLRYDMFVTRHIGGHADIAYETITGSPYVDVEDAMADVEEWIRADYEIRLDWQNGSSK